jgi:hypothetical protein
MRANVKETQLFPTSGGNSAILMILEEREEQNNLSEPCLTHTQTRTYRATNMF